MRWAENQEAGWCDKHIEAYVNIAGPVLGVPKAVSACMSGQPSLSGHVAAGCCLTFSGCCSDFSAVKGMQQYDQAVVQFAVLHVCLCTQAGLHNTLQVNHAQVQNGITVAAFLVWHTDQPC